MKHTSKILIALLVLATMLMSLTVISASAEDTTYVFEAKDLIAFQDGDDEDDGKNTTAENPYEGLQTVVDDYFTIIFGEKSKVDSSKKTFGTEGDADYYYSEQRLNFGGKSTLSKQVIKFTTASAAKIKVWWVCGGDGGRYIGILNGEKNEDDSYVEIDQTEAGVKDSLYVSTLSVDAAGEYYLANLVNNNYIFKVEVTEKAATEPETPAHVNKLEVGENKIVIDGDPTFSGYNVEYIIFNAEEKANYKFEGEGVVCHISSADGQTLISNNGVADLEAGNYLITVWSSSPEFIPGPTGTFDVTVTKTAIEQPGEGEEGGETPAPHVNKVVYGQDNKLICTDAFPVGQFGPYEFMMVVIPEDGHYKFGGKGLGFTIYTTEINAEGADFTPNTGASWGTWKATEADLNAGTYWIGIVYAAGPGEYTATIEKVVEEQPEQPEQPAEPEQTPDETPDEEPVELNFFQKILKAVKDFFANIGVWFKNLFAKKG